MSKLLIIFILTGCTTVDTKYVIVPVDCPVKGVLPKIDRKELSCITDNTYNKLNDRENTLLDYIVNLEKNAGCKK